MTVQPHAISFGVYTCDLCDEVSYHWKGKDQLLLDVRTARTPPQWQDLHDWGWRQVIWYSENRGGDGKTYHLCGKCYGDSPELWSKLDTERARRAADIIPIFGPLTGYDLYLLNHLGGYEPTT
jgi:hypothetical protein